MRPKTNINKDYCERFPVRRNSYGQLKDGGNSVGIYLDQYESLKDFVNDIHKRFRPHGGKEFYKAQGVMQVGSSDKLICKRKESMFYGQTVINPYLISAKYKDLRQHYFVS